ncbi:MAG: TonB-dependent receptor [Acidobacteria bacterium]|nr:TonB-dependent receptor [Acidobacteriota bacterium]
MQHGLSYAKRCLWRAPLLALACLLVVTGVLGQDLLTRGSINGRVTDSTGAAIANAKVTVTGATGERTVMANEAGDFDIPNLLPGVYTIRIEQTGFRAVSVPNISVNVGKTSSLKLVLEPGNITEVVEVSAGAATVDTSSTAIGQNLNDQLFVNIPVERNVSSLFYLAPGVADSGKGGRANPSISGGSALDNLYVADGVNITDSAFGGLGVFSRNFGTIGVGINTSFIKEVQVKTGGFEPQYGQSQGGIINIITQSGGTSYHGALYGYARPQALEAERRQPDDIRTNKFGKLLHEENYDAGFDLGGPVPGLRKKVFFFGSFNPTVRREIVSGAEGSGLQQALGDTHRRYRTLNYAFKLDANLTANHQVAFSIFGDPTVTNTAPFVTLNIDNLTALNKLDFGTRNISARYNGTLTPTWTVSASFSQGRNRFDETGFSDFNLIQDLTQPVRGNFDAIGYGFYEPTDSNTYRATFDTTKQASLLGQHTLGLGYQYQRAFYDGTRDRSGPKFTVPATNATGVPVTQLAGNSAAAIGQPLNAEFELFTAPDSCTLCPFMNIPGVGDSRVYLRHRRGEYGNTSFETRSNYHSAYIQDTWRVNRFLTVLGGLRQEQERLIGNPGSDGTRIGYSFTGNWAPRVGATVDPLGRGTTKVYYNFGRFFEFIPLDLAERSLSAETDFRGGRYSPDYEIVNGVRRARINQFGTVTPIIDADHLLTGAAGGTGSTISVSLSNPSSPILPGTKLGYSDEHLVGFEQQLPGNWVFSVRYLDRRIKRIVEDAAVVAPESADFFGQTYFIGNIGANTDAAINPIGFRFTPGGAIPSQCDPGLVNSDLGICYAANGENGQPAGDPGSDGVADGFPDAIRKYRAVEIELNKRFSNSWQLIANWRIAKVTGNYEGHYRNDNGQKDPAISSLFDFTEGEFNLLGDQFAVGPLNTDRRHIANIYGSYQFGQQRFGNLLKGLNLGAGIQMMSGVPISEYLAHPVYLNAGEIPVGGRGKLGRTPFFAKLDLHADYKFSLTEQLRLTLIGDFFNVTNNQRVRLPDMFRESTAGQNNPDFLQPGIAKTDLTRGYYLPFNMRLGVRLEF